MFPLHQSKKLVFQISSNPPQKHTTSSEDRILGHAKMGKSRRRKLAASNLDHNMIDDGDDDKNSNHDHKKKKKMMTHRENERQRRQEMGTLHASLRSLLPLESIKGKRSISDHMNEAVNYIRHLQTRVKRLDAKRQELKKLSSITSTTTSTDGRDGGGDQIWPSCFAVHRCCGGVQIVIRSRDDGFSGEVSISAVLGVVVEKGLMVASCVSSQVNDRFLHTIQCEVNDLESINLSGLEQRLAEMFPISTS